MAKNTDKKMEIFIMFVLGLVHDRIYGVIDKIVGFKVGRLQDSDKKW